MIDRYTKAVLTLIATALVYLCVMLTPLPSVQAQGTQRPGEPTGPLSVVVVGWRGAPGETLPISTAVPVPVTVATPIQVTGPIQITGRVTTDQAVERADRVVLVGWEEGATRDGRAARPLSAFTESSSLPVNVKR